MNEDQLLEDTPESDTSGRRKTQSPLAVRIREIRKSSPYKKQVERYRLRASQFRHSDGTRGMRCGLCGGAINFNLKHPHPDSFSVDHIIAVKLRPDLIMDVNNWQPAHLSCNSSKGDDDDPLSPGCLGTPSEAW